MGLLHIEHVSSAGSRHAVDIEEKNNGQNSLGWKGREKGHGPAAQRSELSTPITGDGISFPSRLSAQQRPAGENALSSLLEPSRERCTVDAR